MFAFFLAGIVTLVGAAGLVFLSLVRLGPAGDAVFNAASVCLVVGPLIFFSYVIFGLCLEFISGEQIPAGQAAARARSFDAPSTSASPVAFDLGLPEGLRRERKGPLNRSTGRAPAL